MPKDRDAGCGSGDARWARFRFSVVGGLLAAPPERGALKEELERLAAKPWRHPIHGEWVRFGVSTIERWYYRARGERTDPVGVLGRKIREDQGCFKRMSPELRAALRAQYREHPGWSYQLHRDNLAALAEVDPRWGPAPSAPTVRRYMQAHGMIKRPRRSRRHTAAGEAAERRFEAREIRSYESEYVNALVHLDFHGGSLRVACSNGEWAQPQLLGMLDDHSRLCLHAQWYLAETAENLVHGLCQGFEKRGLPRALMSDNGSAMIATETVQGLGRLGIVHERTLPYSAYQNGKQEVFWARVEGRLLAMLEGCRELSLGYLNQATQAWVELEYNRTVHAETGQTPLERFVEGRSVGRDAPGSEVLRQAFTAQLTRVPRRSDGTLTVEGVRFELPSQYRHLRRVSVRVAGWDLSGVYLADPRSGQILCRLYPQDKHRNAEGRRRRQAPWPDEPAVAAAPPAEPVAPLLRALIARYAATGLPPAYLPKDERARERREEDA